MQTNSHWQQLIDSSRDLPSHRRVFLERRAIQIALDCLKDRSGGLHLESRYGQAFLSFRSLATTYTELGQRRNRHNVMLESFQTFLDASLNEDLSRQERRLAFSFLEMATNDIMSITDVSNVPGGFFDVPDQFAFAQLSFKVLG